MLKHSFPPVARTDARLLVCGSLPGEASLAAGRYYAHPQNQFWRLISAAIRRDIAALPYEARLAALLGAHVGLWDVVASARRTGSTDAALEDVEPHDIDALAESLPQLRAIAFNGGTAHRHGLRQLRGKLGRYTVIALPSSSPLHTVGFTSKRPAWEALKAYIS